MRVLHTSDWHLGRTFHGGSLLDEQQRMVDEVVALAAERNVDAVIIAGDLYDRAIPSVEAVELWVQAVERLRATGAVVIAIAGNHDSARRVSVHDRLLEASGVIIRGDVARCADPVMVTPNDGGDPVAIYAVPYLDPVSAKSAFGDDAYEPAPNDDDGSARRRVTHRSITQAALDRVRADLAERGAPRSIVVAHTFVTGGTSSESERDITLGNVENVPLDVFDGIGYVALGHLHGPQGFDGGRIAYSGSPLPYSFSEQHHNKSVRIVTLDEAGTPTVEVVGLDVDMALATITGTIDELLAPDAFVEATGAFVRVLLTDLHLPLQAMTRLRERYPKAVELRHVPNGIDAILGSEASSVESRRDAPPAELAAAFFTDQEGRPPTEDETSLINAALTAALGVER